MPIRRHIRSRNNGQPSASRVFKPLVEVRGPTKLSPFDERPSSNNDRRGPASSFDRLPVELKVEIFDQCLDPYPPFSAHWPPLLLSYVSTSWRAIVQTAPKLWARFGISFIDSAMDEQRRQKALKLWLERSRSNALSIRICHSPTGRTTDSRSEQVLTTLIHDADRWKDIHLQVPASVLEYLRATLPPSLPALQSLTLETRGLRHTLVPFNIDALRIPWGQLTRLKLLFDHDHLPTLDEYLHVLSQCLKLSQCIINAECTFDNQSGSSHRLVLPALSHLDLILQSEQVTAVDTVESNLVSFLEQFDFPQLHSFSLHWLVKWHGAESRWSGVQAQFLSILSSLDPTLRSLSLAYLPISDGELSGCLQQLHNLIHLDLRFSFSDKESDPITDTFLQACTSIAGKLPPSILPSLESIYLQCYGARHTTNRIIALIQSRWIHGHGNLESFTLVSMQSISTDMRRQLKEWTREGLHVSIEQVAVR